MALFRAHLALPRLARASSLPCPRLGCVVFSSGGTAPPGKSDDDNNKTSRPPSFQSKVVSLVPGIALSAGTSLLAFTSADYIGAALLASQDVDMSQVVASPISGVPISILLGIALNNALPTIINDKSVFSPGLNYCSTTILRLGIVCVGAKLSLPAILSSSLTTLPVIVASVSAGLLVIPKVASLFGLPPNQGKLLSAGTSICGVTAITALAPSINASPRDVSVAVANVVFWGTAGMLLYPHVLHELMFDGSAASSEMVGVMLGVGIHDTSQVLGSAMTYKEMFGDEVVLKSAAVTKLTRNLSLAVVIPGLTYLHVQQQRKTEEAETAAAAAAAAAAPTDHTPKQPTATATMSGLATFKKYVPSFLLGFLGMSAARSLGDWSLAGAGSAFATLDPTTYKALITAVGDDASKLCLGTAMASVGLATSKKVLEGVGPKPFIVGGIGSCIVGGTGLLVLLLSH
jgi:uncharacterized integral membrane protein (TIGR00698 family)